MAQLPPFRTRRSEPAFLTDPEDDSPISERTELDDDVPVLTHVIEPPPVMTPPPSPAKAAPVPPPDLDILAQQVADALQPELRRLVREALEHALQAPASR
ncbi:MAG: hypothetical protein M0R28_02605 [Pigmentiphaga sp.]|nr:hypothetical protein [Pigmentiphaga sp.]